MVQDFSDEDMAEVGRALMAAIKTYADKGWHPIDCPSEIVGDRHNERDELLARVAEQQARIDELMLEYCPDEMTQEQLENWKNHQQAIKENV